MLAGCTDSYMRSASNGEPRLYQPNTLSTKNLNSKSRKSLVKKVYRLNAHSNFTSLKEKVVSPKDSFYLKRELINERVKSHVTAIKDQIKKFEMRSDRFRLPQLKTISSSPSYH